MPYEVHADGVLEGAFPTLEAAQGYANELRGIGAKRIAIRHGLLGLGKP